MSNVPTAKVTAGGIGGGIGSALGLALVQLVSDLAYSGGEVPMAYQGIIMFVGAGLGSVALAYWPKERAANA